MRGRGERELAAVPVFVCADPGGHGHVDRFAGRTAAGAEKRALTDEEKADRRRVIEQQGVARDHGAP